MERIDFHTHCFPEKVAARAMESLSAASGGLRPCTDGTAEGLLARMEAAGVDQSCIMSIATNPKQQKNVNDFAASLASERLIPFGSIYPNAPDQIEELYRIKELGLKGVKLHPEYQGFFVDDPAMAEVYDTIGKLGLVTVFHAGADIGYPPPVHCPPPRLKAALPAFRGAPVVAAHFGGYLLWDEVLEHLAGTNVFLDTSFCYGIMPLPYAKELLMVHGADHILFGSDLPWSDPADGIRFVEAFCENAADQKKIFAENARKILKM